jgi:aryl-alcohol dehydrogenase-like predicted oxidoreductase
MTKGVSAAQARLALGTVQFGLPYGIANRQGQVTLAEAARIIDHGRARGLDTLDTAAAYGDSERRLGQIGVSGWRVVTKLPPLPPSCHDVEEWVESCTRSSLERLRVPQVYGLLVHRAADLASAAGDELVGALQRLKMRGIVGRIGASVYEPGELQAMVRHFPLDLVQAPLNVLDRRFESSGWLGRLKALGTEVHVRSVFLQGLLLLPREARPAKFDRWRLLWDVWDQWLCETGLSAAQACLGFALRHPSINRVVVGVENDAQLSDLLACALPLPDEPPHELVSEDPELIDPSRWGLH